MKSDRGWFATFTLLDAGCAISDAQFRYVTSLARRLWRRTLGAIMRSDCVCS